MPSSRDCSNAKSSEEGVLYKRLNSTETLIQRTTTEAPDLSMGESLRWVRSTFTSCRLSSDAKTISMEMRGSSHSGGWTFVYS
jgi:hypothetical protein